MGAAGTYTISATCGAPFDEVDCADGLDDDADGAIDCEDTDCAGDASCTCAPAASLTCGATISDSTLGAGATDMVPAYDCVSWDESGPEQAYTFQASVDGDVTVTLSGLSSDLDVFVSDGNGCSGADCVAFGNTSATWTAIAGQVYTVIVDGYNGASGGFDLATSCAALMETDCAEGNDNDGDGATDCADADCATDPACVETACTDGSDNDGDSATDCDDSDCASTSDCTCVPDYTLACGGSDSWSTLNPGATDAVDAWSCVGWDESGPEYTYSFTTATAQEVTASISNLGSNDLDIFVVDDAAGYCTSGNCVSYDDTDAVWTALPGQTYYIVVDGYFGDAGTYDIDVSCAAPTTEVACADGVDDDGDGSVDCMDSDCAADPACVETDCADGMDDDGDGAVDCADTDCAADAACTCAPASTLSCGGSDSYNNGYAGSTDVVDQWSCSSWDESGPEYLYEFLAPYDGEFTVALSGLSGDLDLFVADGSVACGGSGCLDYGDSSVTVTMAAGETYLLAVDGYLGVTSDFTVDLSCVPAAEQDCSDGLDDDGDSALDCDDTDCAGDAACTCAPAWTLSCGDTDSWNNGGAGSTDVVDAWSCNTWDESGPEYVYEFLAPYDGQFTLSLSGMTGDLDVFIANGALPCGGHGCLGVGDTFVTGTMTGGDSYFVAVDGFLGDVSDFTLELSCVPGFEQDCSDGIDGDGDGDVDCLDNDCDLSAACSELECGDGMDNDSDGLTDCADEDCASATDCSCVDEFTLNCGGSDTWDTTGGFDLIDQWACTGWDESGPEYTYSFTPVADVLAEVTLTSQSPADLDAFITEDDSGCSAYNCIDYGNTGATWSAVAGTTYYITVDGYLGDQGPYTIDLACY
jgi:hypothetical protein